MTIEIKDLTTYDKKYVCRVSWPSKVLDDGRYEISGVIGDRLTRLLSNMMGCHFRVEGYILHNLLGLRGVPVFASDDECSHVRLVFSDCILDEGTSHQFQNSP